MKGELNDPYTSVNHLHYKETPPCLFLDPLTTSPPHPPFPPANYYLSKSLPIASLLPPSVPRPSLPSTPKPKDEISLLARK